MKNSSDNGMFEHMNSKNLTQADMDKLRHKKRKVNDISNTAAAGATVNLGATTEFKEPQPIKKTAAEIKECEFNPFGNDSCDMCGS